MNPFLSSYSEECVAEEKAAAKKPASACSLTLTAANDDATSAPDADSTEHAANE